jgi:hypothetical protein
VRDAVGGRGVDDVAPTRQWFGTSHPIQRTAQLAER